MNIPKKLTRAFQDALSGAIGFEEGYINPIDYDILCEDFLEQFIEFVRSPDSESSLEVTGENNLAAANPCAFDTEPYFDPWCPEGPKDWPEEIPIGQIICSSGAYNGINYIIETTVTKEGFKRHYHKLNSSGQLICTSNKSPRTP